MTTIQYEIDGKLVDIEVTEEVATAYNAILKDENRAFERDKKRKESSLTLMEEAGFQYADPKSNFAELNYQYEDLYDAIAKLQPHQQKLLYRVFFNGEKKADIAKELGVTKSAISHQLDTIKAELKLILKSFSV
ncbi:MAG: sigma factor-like helix-turn-helix DNA-binding protein [Clostridia bacterium]